MKRKLLAIITAAVFIAFPYADAGVIKGFVYNSDGTLLKTPQADIQVWDTVTNAQLVAGKSNVDGSYSITFDSTKVSTSGTGKGTVFVRYIKNGRTTEIKGASSGGTGTQVGGLIGVPVVTHTLHVTVIGD